jgi:hypothetical protein
LGNTLMPMQEIAWDNGDEVEGGVFQPLQLHHDEGGNVFAKMEIALIH